MLGYCLASSYVSCMRQEAARAFVDGLTALDRNQLMGVGLDPGGSRVLEAALQGPAAGPKARKKLLRQLQGGWALLAVQPGGSHVVEAAYIIAGIKEKERIAQEMAAAEDKIMSTPRGAKLWMRCGVEAYKQGSDEWRKAIGKAAATRQEFAALFGSGSQPAPAASAHPPSTHPADDADGSEDEEDKPLSASSPDAAKPSHSSLGGAANGIAADKGGTKRKRIKPSDLTLAADLTPSSGPAAADGSAQGVGTNARHGRGETQAAAGGTGYGDGEKLVIEDRTPARTKPVLAE
ncbi:hypothetical protein WJX84_012029 [Apatococcus fuscideae]|uniref:Uncharacterized protein n=1 Tax=Apatococcus fuscideae TaxID=2026836 RepID=A0AAW1TGS6_9CHLO